MARHCWLSSNKLLKMKRFFRSASSNDANWKQHLIRRISGEFYLNGVSIYIYGIEIFKIEELRGKVIKLLREEWLKIDKNVICLYAIFRSAFQLWFSNILVGSLKIPLHDVFAFVNEVVI